MEDLLTRYGYIVVFIGTFLEGETVLLVAAYLSHAGYLQIEFTALAGFSGTFIGDQLYFFIGRRWGRSFLSKKPSWEAGLDKVLGMLERHETIFILSFRFIYGLRSVSPFAIGMGDVRAAKFIPLNLVAALIWTAVFCGVGYAAGEAVHAVIGKVEAVEMYIAGALAVAGALIWGIFLYRRRRRTKNRITGGATG